MDREQVEAYIEGDYELDEIMENTFDCPHCGTTVPKKSNYCLSCQSKVEPESD